MPASRQRWPKTSETYWADSIGRRNARWRGVAMGEKRRAADRAGRPMMRSPGRPPVGTVGASAAVLGGDRSRGVERGRRCGRPGCRRRLASGGFARVAGCRPSRWPRRRGGICRLPSGRRSRSCAPGAGVREIARRLGRSPSTISRELRRNAATRSGGFDVPGHDRAVACRPARAAPEAREARRQHRVAPLRAGPPVRGGAAPRRRSPSTAREVEWIGGVTVGARTGAGRGRGARSRSPTGCAGLPR